MARCPTRLRMTGSCDGRGIAAPFGRASAKEPPARHIQIEVLQRAEGPEFLVRLRTLSSVIPTIPRGKTQTRRQPLPYTPRVRVGVRSARGFLERRPA